MDLPLGYREFATHFGRGVICDALFIDMPNEILNPPDWRRGDREHFQFMKERFTEENAASGLKPDDMDETVIFANAERYMFFACRKLAGRLFFWVDGDIVELLNGFYEVPDFYAARVRQDFPFFEPFNGRRKMCDFLVGPGIGGPGFVDALTRRWGSNASRQSRTFEGGGYVSVFLPAIESRFEVNVDSIAARMPHRNFAVRAWYDMDYESELIAFAEPVVLPGREITIHY